MKTQQIPSQLSPQLPQSLLPLLVSLLHSKQSQIQQIKQQIYYQSDQYYTTLIQKQTTLYNQLQQQTKQCQKIKKQLEELQDMYQRLENMEEEYRREVEELGVMEREGRNGVREERDRGVVSGKISQERQPQLKQEYEKYRQNRKKYAYLLNKNKQLTTKLHNQTNRHQPTNPMISPFISNSNISNTSHNNTKNSHKYSLDNTNKQKQKQQHNEQSKYEDEEGSTLSTLINAVKTVNRVSVIGDVNRDGNDLKLETLCQFDI